MNSRVTMLMLKNLVRISLGCVLIGSIRQCKKLIWGVKIVIGRIFVYIITCVSLVFHLSSSESFSLSIKMCLGKKLPSCLVKYTPGKVTDGRVVRAGISVS